MLFHSFQFSIAIIILVIFFFPDIFPTKTVYTFDFKSRFLISLGLISVLAYIFESVLMKKNTQLMLELRERKKVEEALRDAHDQLEIRVRDAETERPISNCCVYTQISARRNITGGSGLRLPRQFTSPDGEFFFEDLVPDEYLVAVRASGYRTAAFVSAFVLDSRWGIGRGFDTYFDEFDLKENESANLGSVQRDGADTIAEAIRWLDSNPEQPLFLWLHLYDAHDPYEPIEPYRSQYPNRPYEGEVAYTDFTELPFADGTRKAHLVPIIGHVCKMAYGWAVGGSANTALALKAWQRAKRTFQEYEIPYEGMIIHHDQDAVFTSYDWTGQLLMKDHVRVSYALGGAKDNPEMESFTGRFKEENQSLCLDAQNLAELAAMVDEQMRYYNIERRHSAISYQAPLTYIKRAWLCLIE